MSARWALVTFALVSCAPATDPDLSLVISPSVMDAFGRSVRVHAVATNADGTIGVGTVTISTSLGELDDTSFTLDDFGTATTTLSCPSSDAACTPGSDLTVTAVWKRTKAPLEVTGEKKVHLATPPPMWSPQSCASESKLVYLFTDTAQLLSFDPASKTLHVIGSLVCPTQASPNSMAVSQDGIGWLNYSDGSLFRVNVRTASCQATTFVPPPGWTQFGMGFAPDSANSPTETLFISGSASQGLAKIDLTTMHTTVIGDFTGVITGSAELTATGDGQLYGYFVPTSGSGPMSLARIDRTTGLTSGLRTFQDLSLTPTQFAFAFSAWQGDFYLYTSSGTALSSVTRYDPPTDAESVWLTPAQVGVRIVGAGVSRCGQ
jgi:hypothetical protein